MCVTAVIPAAGFGSRLKQRIPKALVKIGGRPIFIHTLATVSAHPEIKNIILLVPTGYLKIFRRQLKVYRIKKLCAVIPGGATRRQSVEKGLRLLPPDTRWVLIHDAARPFIEKKTISTVIQAAKIFSAAVTGVPLKPTVKQINPHPSGRKKSFFVEKTLKREQLWEIQTPQVFKKELILKAYAQCKERSPGDDAYLVEKLNAKVKVVLGSYFNIKITSPEDLVFAQAIIRKNLN